MHRSDRSIDEYLGGLPDERRPEVEVLHGLLSDLFAGDDIVLYEGRFWGGTDQQIIGYRPILQSRSDGSQVEWFAVGLAMQKQYLSLYVSAVEDGQYLSKQRGSGLGKVKVGSSSVSFNSLDDIDMDALRAFLTRARDLSPPSGNP